MVNVEEARLGAEMGDRVQVSIMSSTVMSLYELERVRALCELGVIDKQEYLEYIEKIHDVHLKNVDMYMGLLKKYKE